MRYGIRFHEYAWAFATHTCHSIYTIYCVWKTSRFHWRLCGLFSFSALSRCRLFSLWNRFGSLRIFNVWFHFFWVKTEIFASVCTKFHQTTVWQTVWNFTPKCTLNFFFVLNIQILQRRKREPLKSLCTSRALHTWTTAAAYTISMYQRASDILKKDTATHDNNGEASSNDVKETKYEKSKSSFNEHCWTRSIIYKFFCIILQLDHLWAGKL